MKLLDLGGDDDSGIINNNIDVYDDFVKVKTIALSSRPNGYTLIRSREGVITKNNIAKRQERHFNSLEEAVDTIASMKFDYQYEDNAGNIILVQDVYDFFRYKEFGTKYPQRYFVYEVNTGIMYSCADNYEIAYTGSWTETKEENGSGDEGDINVCRFVDYDSANRCDDNNVVLTQTLFNSDSKYEYVRFKWGVEAGNTFTQDRDGDGEVDYERTSYYVVGTGFEIVAEDGTVLQSVDFPVGKADSYDHGKILKLNGKYYLLFETCEGEYDRPLNFYSLVYSIGGGSTAVQQVGALHHISARPSLAERNAPITVETPAAQRDRRLTVTNAAGQTVWQQTIPAGQGSVQIDGRRLSRGLNIVNVDGDSKQDNSCKVIVK